MTVPIPNYDPAIYASIFGLVGYLEYRLRVQDAERDRDHKRRMAELWQEIYDRQR
jgi:hypothetical protein